MPFEPVLTTEDTPAGKAFQMLDGRVKVKNPEGEEVAWRINDYATKLHDVKTEAQAYREAFVSLASSTGHSGAIKSPKDVPDLLTSLETVGADREELTGLRRLKEAGELGEDADAKIQASAKKLYGEDYAKVEARAKKALAERAEFEAQASRDRSELHTSKTEEAFADLYDRCMADKTGKLPVLAEGGRSMFISAGMSADGKGRRWGWTKEHNKAGIATIVQRDATGENVRLGPDGIDPLDVRRWVETDLREIAPLLFKSPNGSDPLNPGQPGAKALHDLTPAQVRARVDQGA